MLYCYKGLSCVNTSHFHFFPIDNLLESLLFYGQYAYKYTNHARSLFVRFVWFSFLCLSVLVWVLVGYEEDLNT